MSIFNNKDNIHKDAQDTMKSALKDVLEIHNEAYIKWNIDDIIDISAGRINFYIKYGSNMRNFIINVRGELPFGLRLGNIYTDYNCHTITVDLPMDQADSRKFIPIDIIRNKSNEPYKINEFKLILKIKNLKDIDLTECKIQNVKCETASQFAKDYVVHVNPDIDMDALGVSNFIDSIDYNGRTSEYKIGTLYLTKYAAEKFIIDRDLLKVNINDVKIR